jgi:Prokaryotic E2 family E
MRPGNRYPREHGFSRTLGQLVDSKMALVAICRRSKHERVLYPTKKLDSFYTQPFLKRHDGADPSCATQRQSHFAEEWQFWSRHLNEHEWRPSDGLHTFIQYIRAELATA